MLLGKLPPKDDSRTLQLKDYIKYDALPTPPKDIRWGKSLPSTGNGLMGNDVYGDCTCAAVGHLTQIWTSNTGQEVTISDTDILNAYWKTGDGTDDGRTCIDVLNYWRQSGVAGHTISGYVQVDNTNLSEVQTALWLFGGLYIGIALPVTAQNQSKWTVVGDPNNDPNSQPGSWGGHCVEVHASIPFWGYTCLTWGDKMGMTWNFWKTYTDECYVALSEDWINQTKQLAPNGFDFSTLQSDLSNVTK